MKHKIIMIYDMGSYALNRSICKFNFCYKMHTLIESYNCINQNGFNVFKHKILLIS